jgi:hypothetical protein
VPSLDLRFAENKTLGDAVGGGSLVTFTRASTATFTGSDGLITSATTNEARFDHNPTTGESLGLLVEEGRTNSYQYSEEFDNAYWSKATADGTVTANQIASPDGAVTADLYQENTATSSRYLARSISFTSGTVYTVSVWAKQAVGATRYLGFIMPLGIFGVNVNCTYILSGAGTASINVSGTSTTASIQAFANGWYRCTLTSQATATGSVGTQFRLSNSSTNASSSYTGDGTSGIYLWGAQLEAGAFATSYIPTTTATATRAADVASITGSNFSSWYNQTEGTVFARGQGLSTTGTFTSFETGNSSVSNSILLGGLSGTTTFRVRGPSSTTQAQISLIATGTLQSFAGAYALNSFNATYGGQVSGTDDTSGTPPSAIDNLKIGVNASAGTELNGTIRRLCFWPTRLSNITLQQITQP